MWVAGDAYWTYAICIFAITWFSIITSAVEAHSNMRRLADIAYFASEVRRRKKEREWVWLGGGVWMKKSMREVAKRWARARRVLRRARGAPAACCVLGRPSLIPPTHTQTQVDVLRDGRFVRLPSPALVPGDVVAVGPGALSCDCVLLSGEVIADENMLTGESVPVRKVRGSSPASHCSFLRPGGRTLLLSHTPPLAPRPSRPASTPTAPPRPRPQVPYSPTADGLAYGPDRDAACTLYGGTVVAQARAPKGAPALAMVVRTRFYSAKGQLLR